MIEFHDPRGESAVATEPYELSHDLTANDGDGTTVGLLANGFPDSESFLDALGEALRARLPRLEVRSWNKVDATVPAPQPILDEIRAHCQVAIAAYGH